MKLHKILLVFAVSLLTLQACNEEGSSSTTTTTTTTPAKPKVKVDVPTFDGALAYDLVEKQVAFGPRVPNSKTHDDCAAWMVQTLKGYGLKVIEQKFNATAYDGTILRSTNIIASYRPGLSKRVLLCAHWDTRPIADQDTERQEQPILGADDGGSGVGVLMAIGKMLAEADDLDMGVDFVLFDSEDYGPPDTQRGNATDWCLGSQHWAQNLHANNYRAKFGILLDMVGSKMPRFPKEGTSLKYARPIMDKTWKIASELGYGGFFDDTVSGGVIDDHVFVNEYARIPTIDIINRDATKDSGFGTHWHTHGDNMDIIDTNTLKAVGQVVLTVLYREAAGQF